MASAGPRYFGFVTGGSLDAARCRRLCSPRLGPVRLQRRARARRPSPFEDVAGELAERAAALPATASVGFVTGGQAANTVGLAAGRWHGARTGAVGTSGATACIGAPRVRVLAGIERARDDRPGAAAARARASARSSRSRRRPTVRWMPDALVAALGAGPADRRIVCAQAGNVNTGACDDLRRSVPPPAQHGAWVHVDGAFGLWAAASPRTRARRRASSAPTPGRCDGHKWLNVPYDSGFAFCARSGGPRDRDGVHRRRTSLARWRAGPSAAVTSFPSRRPRRASRRGPRSARWAGTGSPTSSSAAAARPPLRGPARAARGRRGRQ